ncbi:hypothetical protein PF005_g230 [Phytophthora fragariae]|uniref:Uncharacterized protein n=1 Tax=Phytophthora fragariae TaxID=53985 RepID=A0A6A3FZW6_9STRA|nr:hypothetical protein PF003_g8310 [Phytophthora fragariae]KAE8950031.1 hypothetical protein PF009_g429 [Phytophthora fragariae]KAE9031261.1 hypothetical protein PF011_g204 [Phytophthora fragariae]KAE9140349.1 hypothetical protein PF010_g228 [Phytophthora fragariae]KAE9141064.1 hypothetical protein PF007_g390 [Phytophthora fragariae]
MFFSNSAISTSVSSLCAASVLKSSLELCTAAPASTCMSDSPCLACSKSFFFFCCRLLLRASRFFKVSASTSD